MLKTIRYLSPADEADESGHDRAAHHGIKIRNGLTLWDVHCADPEAANGVPVNHDTGSLAIYSESDALTLRGRARLLNRGLFLVTVVM